MTNEADQKKGEEAKKENQGRLPSQENEVGPQNDLMAAQPTPKVMSVVRVGSEGAEPHYNPDPTPVTEGGGDVTSPRPFLYVSTTAPAGEAPAAAAAPSTEASPARGGATDICLKRTSALLETSCPALEDI
ncbi:hypothetical protein Pcinc_039903 [Petrolisthes cinctipes]|uniref:Uncharacterized protein n=1 Tax=Petrolisthes cinctipes TaxID=88211 RepID=A0AAE1BMQ6_PETCI|nr:hypothetical protein Pcinc_039903 [Petrolisthes cinctipes]